MAIEVTLYIDPMVHEDRIAKIGGRVVRWEPGTDGAPIRATFVFKNAARFDKFLADALTIQGIALPASEDPSIQRTDKRNGS